MLEKQSLKTQVLRSRHFFGRLRFQIEIPILPKPTPAKLGRYCITIFNSSFDKINKGKLAEVKTEEAEKKK